MGCDWQELRKETFSPATFAAIQFVQHPMTKMTRFFEEIVRRPLEAVASSVRILCEEAPDITKLDAFISRATHALGRSCTPRGIASSVLFRPTSSSSNCAQVPEVLTGRGQGQRKREL